MKKGYRQRIADARDRLGLGESASINEIRRAYRRLVKEHHPDLAGDEEAAAMHALNDAYRLLLDFCNSYAVPLPPEDVEPQSDEEWWLNRFGNDPLWGKG